MNTGITSESLVSWYISILIIPYIFTIITSISVNDLFISIFILLLWLYIDTTKLALILQQIASSSIHLISIIHYNLQKNPAFTNNKFTIDNFL